MQLKVSCTRVALLIIEGYGALVNPSEKHQYRNKGNQPFKMICMVPKELEKLERRSLLSLIQW